MTTRGVFKLSSYRSQELQGDGVPIDDVWYTDQLQQEGYVVGGSDSSDNSVSYYQAISYTSYTRSNVANLPQGRSGVYGLASTSNGYVVGGGPGNPSQPSSTYYSSTVKLNFATQTSSALPGVNMSQAYGRGGSAGSTTAGYICGGYSGPGGEPTGWSRLEKITYSNDVMQRLPGSNLPGVGYGGATGWDHSATGNGEEFGVWVGGNIYPSPNPWLTGSSVFKITYSNDSWNHSTSWNLSGPSNRTQKTGFSSSETHGYLVGGSYPAKTIVQKISFADMTNSVVTNSASPGRTDLTATGNISTGYYAGGATGNNSNGTGGSVSSIVEKMSFGSDTISRVPALDLANGLSNVGSMSAAGDNKVPPVPKRWIDGEVETTANHAYFGMGFPSSGNGVFKKLDLDTETVTGSWQFYSPGKQQYAVGSTLTHGYSLAGAYQGGARSNVFKWAYATNSGSQNPSSLNRTRRSANSSSTRTHGYVVGGYSDFPTPDGTKSDITKYSFSTDTSLGNITGNLPEVNEAGMGVGTQDVGYHTKGSGSYIWKINYSSDTVSTLTALLPYTRREMTTSSMGSGTTGYFVGGSPGPRSSIDKLDYATDTLSAGSNMSNPANRGQATSNTEVGYIERGAPAQPSANTNKYVFSTDTVSDKGNLFNHNPNTYATALSVRMSNQSGIIPAPPAVTKTDSIVATPKSGVPNHGYFGTGQNQQYVNKLSFASGTSATSPSSMPLTSNFYDYQVLSSPTVWYLSGGDGDGSPARWSGTDKITYATDTKSLNIQNMPSAVRAPGNPSYYGNKDMSPFSYPTGGKGYLAGGRDSAVGGRSNTYKFTYASETYSDMPSSKVIDPRAKAYTRSSATAGYRTGGQEPAPATNTSKMTFSAETWIAVPGADGVMPSPSPSNFVFQGASAGTSKHALWMGSQSNTSVTNKLDYSTETISMGGNLARGEGNIGQAQDNETSYIVGGGHSSYQKYVFATDTASEAGVNNTNPGYNKGEGGSAYNDLGGYDVGSALI